MNAFARRAAVSMVALASLCGCKALGSFAANSPTTVLRLASKIFRMATAPPTPALERYKAEVAHRVVESNPGLTFGGNLPKDLRALVVLAITVDRNGNLVEVAVLRYSDTDATWIAVTSVRLSDPLPRPHDVPIGHDGLLTFSETFLFNSRNRFQMQSLTAPP